MESPPSLNPAEPNNPVTRAEFDAVRVQLTSVSERLKALWEDYKDKADVKTVQEMDQIQRRHGENISALQTDMTNVKDKQDQIWWLTPVVTIYQKIVTKTNWAEIWKVVAIAVVVALGFLGYWLTVGKGMENIREQDRLDVAYRDSVEHSHKMEELRLQIELQNAVRPEAPRITVERDGTVVDNSSGQSDSLPANFGIDAELYPELDYPETR